MIEIHVPTNRPQPTGRGSGLATSSTNGAILCMGLAVMISSTQINIWIVPLLLFSIMYLLQPSRRSDSDFLRIFPLGMQLEPSGNKAPIFISREEIEDCVVNEELLAHRVRNRILLRLASGRQVNVFPNCDDLSFVQCLELRSNILLSMETYGILSG
mmetsp:Transcript_27251/g.75169  ORF Transcript_27251/g.75169 Transcript_27251/m.75169 type:complete len:157 (-) Transcript_27251:5173-5643(-)